MEQNRIDGLKVFFAGGFSLVISVVLAVLVLLVVGTVLIYGWRAVAVLVFVIGAGYFFWGDNRAREKR